MSLVILNSELEPLTELMSSHNGFTGGAHEEKIYIRNYSSEFYYTNLRIKPEMPELIEGDLFSSTGWSVKLRYGEEQPTDKEWGEVLINSACDLPGLGNNSVANTETAIPVWVRIYCPGHESPKVKNDINLKLTFVKRVIGDI